VAKRISDVLGKKVDAAIDALPVLMLIRIEAEWEIAPALLPGGNGVSLPVPGSVGDDYVLYMAPLDDPHASQETVNGLVSGLYGKCQAEVDEIRARLRAQSNGRRQSPGGLIVP
jgi:hypothetical protein